MVILLQLNKTELYKMRMAACTWQRHITFDTELAFRMNNVCFLLFFFVSTAFVETGWPVLLLMPGSEWWL